MELRHLRYFAAVAQTCHFGRAAERLHMAQPALSQSIRQLEDELGATLLTRTTRQVSLTPAGEFFYEETRRVLEAVEASTAGVRRVADGHRGLARVGLTGIAAFTILPFLARTWQQTLPDVALEVHADMLTRDQSEALREGSLDVAVLRPPADGDGLVTRTIEVEPLVLVVPADHRLAEEPVISLTDLRAESFVLYGNRESTVDQVVQRACREAGFTPHAEHRAPGTSVLVALVAAGLGVSLVPGSVRSIPLPGVVFREIADAPTVDHALAWRESPSTLVQSLLDTLEQAGLFDDLTTTTPEALR